MTVLPKLPWRHTVECPRGDDDRMFRFTTSSEEPRARVRCLRCGWEVEGDDIGATYRQADTHECPSTVVEVEPRELRKGDVMLAPHPDMPRARIMYASETIFGATVHYFDPADATRDAADKPIRYVSAIPAERRVRVERY